MAGIARALISVSDKSGVVELARGLVEMGGEILSTGGTAKTLREGGVPVTDVSEYTGFPELLDGRVKTLHPKVHGGILGRRDLPKHEAQMEAHGILPIDLVAVNLYPFEATIRKPQVTLEEAIENIDIGGPSMVRSAAKNYPQVVVLVDPTDYDLVLTQLRENGEVSPETRHHLAQKAFQHTARYDSLIAAYLDRVSGPPETTRPFPPIFSFQLEKVQDLRYGENPHQRGSFYRELDSGEPSVAASRQLHGKALSFNNVLDANAALELAKEFEAPTAAIIKHNNPCGVGTGDGLLEAYQRALKTDPVSAFGGVIAFNRRVDLDTAMEVSRLFVEVIVAPGFDPTALEVLARKKNLRLLETGEPLIRQPGTWDLKRVVGGLLVQDRDLGAVEDIGALNAVTQRRPTEEETAAMAFAWKVCKHVRSNAIVYAAPDRTLGVGAGQMSRVDSARLAILKSGEAGLSLKGATMASDAFFPFRDGLDVAAKAGITAVIQPGGSVKDPDVIAAADEHGMAMVFTGMRHFRH